MFWGLIGGQLEIWLSAPWFAWNIYRTLYLRSPYWECWSRRSRSRLLGWPAPSSRCPQLPAVGPDSLCTFPCRPHLRTINFFFFFIKTWDVYNDSLKILYVFFSDFNHAKSSGVKFHSYSKVKSLKESNLTLPEWNLTLLESNDHSIPIECFSCTLI